MPPILFSSSLSKHHFIVYLNFHILWAIQPNSLKSKVRERVNLKCEKYKFLLLFPPPPPSSSVEYRTRFIVQINSKPANRESTNHLFKFFFFFLCDDNWENSLIYLDNERYKKIWKNENFLPWKFIFFYFQKQTHE